MKLTGIIFLLALLSLSAFAQAPVAQDATQYPSFTLKIRATTYAPDGTTSVLDETFYAGSSGYSRSVVTDSNGTAREHYYRPARPLTAEQLKSLKGFDRIETLLGLTAYVIRLRDQAGYLVAESYRTAELGWVPLKSIRYNGAGKPVEVKEPVSVVFGQPASSLLDEDEARQKAISEPIEGGVLNGKAIKLPVPKYPEEARGSRISGTVTVRITIAEDGHVEHAEAVSGDPHLQKAAVKAAYQALFTPTKLSGQPVKVTGSVVYRFEAQ